MKVPIYDYKCGGCGHVFELLVLKGTVPACPECAGEDLERLVSAPAIKSETTHALSMKAAKKRDRIRGEERAREQREYELHHND